MKEPGADEFEAMVAAAYDRLPQPFRSLSDGVAIRTAEFAEPEVLADLDIGDPYGLLGLYHGVDVTRKSLWDISPEQDMVFLYRKPILRFWREGTDSLEHIVEHVLVHEIGHHFGLSDDDMHGLEDEADAEEGG